jgi:hypothetical protein
MELQVLKDVEVVLVPFINGLALAMLGSLFGRVKNALPE